MPTQQPTFSKEPASTCADSIHTLYCRHNSWLIGWLAKTLGCPQNAADLAQDTFVRVMTRCDATAVSEHRPWLLTIAKRLLIDKSRRRQLEQAYLAELQLSLQATAVAPSSEQILMAVQTLELIASALDTLAEKPRQAFLLRYVDCLTQADIAGQLGVSITMVRKYLVQGLVACHEFIDDESLQLLQVKP